MDTLKKELWELLRIFDHICREEHIDYWVDYGTLLGAVRHQGFIPWDDDIDVSMRYEDYLHFFEVCDKYFPPNVRAVNYDRRKDCITPFRGYLQNTSILLEDVLGDTIMAFIDIFFYTGVPENPYARRLDQMNLLWKSLRVTKTPLSEDKGNSIARTAKKAFNRLIIDHNNPRRTQRVMSSMKKKLTKARPCSESNLISLGYSSPSDYGPTVVRTSDVFPLGEVSFEGLTVMAPGNPDAYLRHLYGDYMQLPPEEERQGKHVLRILSTEGQNDKSPEACC